MKKAVISVIVICMIFMSCNGCSLVSELGQSIADGNGIFNAVFGNADSTESESETLPKITFDFSSAESPLTEDEYYNYSVLDEDSRLMYIRVYDAVIASKPGMIIAENNSERDAVVAMYAVLNDHPEIFWVDYDYGVGTTAGNKAYVIFDLDDEGYFYSHEERVEMMDRLNDAVESIFDQIITEQMTDYEIELAVHDWLCQNVEYDLEADKLGKDTERDESNHLPWTAYGALVNRSAVCEGYSKAFQLLMYYAGINSSIVSGEVSNQSAHSWNIVEINDEWYHVDCLWDDDDVPEYPTHHAFFNVTDDFISKTHYISDDVNDIDNIEEIYSSEYNLSLPECNSTEYNYFVVNDTVISSDAEYKTVIKRSFEKASKSDIGYVEFFYSYKDSDEKVVGFDIKKNNIFSATKGYYNDFKGLKYIAYSYGNFIIEVSR